jgi:hypothetical protein
LRLLFSCYNFYVDPSNGAAQATRDLLRLLTARGWDCRVLCGPQLDFAEDQSPGHALGAQQLPFTVRYGQSGAMSFSVADLRLDEIPITIYAPAVSKRPDPSREEGLPFLGLLVKTLESFRPQVLLTYGGHSVGRETIGCAKRRAVPVVFALHNLAYPEAAMFRPVDAVLVPSQFARDHYQRALGLDCTVLPSPLDWTRLRCPQVDGRYVTFINPEPAKGLLLFARIATELARVRPDIPLLVVEGRVKAGWLDHTGLDLRSLPNLHVMNMASSMSLIRNRTRASSPRSATR